MRGIRLSDRVLVNGDTGDGKSTLIHCIVASLQPIRTIIVDPKEDPPLMRMLSRVPVIRDVRELPEALRQPVCHWVPENPNNIKELEAGYRAIWKCPGPYLVWDDELADVTGPNLIVPSHAGLIKKGRAHNKLWIGATQRLSETNPTCRSQAEHLIAMTPSPVDVDLVKLARYMQLSPDQLQAELNDLHDAAGKYSHLWYVKETREHRRMSPCPPPPYTWPARPRVAPSTPAHPDADPPSPEGPEGAPQDSEVLLQSAE